MKSVKKHRLVQVGYIRLLTLQFAVVSLIALSFWWLVGEHYAYSAFLGGLICIIPGVIFAVNVFKHRGAHAAKKIVQRFYLGEGLKIIVSFLLFAVVFIFIPVAALPFFVTFIVVQLSYWFAPLLLKR